MTEKERLAIKKARDAKRADKLLHEINYTIQQIDKATVNKIVKSVKNKHNG